MSPEGSRALGPDQAKALSQAAKGAICGKAAAQAGGQDRPKRLEYRAMQRLLQHVFCRSRDSQG